MAVSRRRHLTVVTAAQDATHHLQAAHVAVGVLEEAATSQHRSCGLAADQQACVGAGARAGVVGRRGHLGGGEHLIGRVVDDQAAAGLLRLAQLHFLDAPFCPPPLARQFCIQVILQGLVVLALADPVDDEDEEENGRDQAEQKAAENARQQGRAPDQLFQLQVAPERRYIS